MKENRMKAIFSANTLERIFRYYTEEVGYDIIPFDKGFCFYTIEDDCFVLQELYLEDSEGLSDYKKAWKEIEYFCELHKLKYVYGFVNIAKDNAEKILSLHIYCGAKIIGANNNEIKIMRKVR